MRTFDKITDLIGGTPILKLNNLLPETRIIAK